MEKTTFGIVGAGWRAEFFLRVATARPDFFGVSGIVVRNPEKARSVREKWNVPVFPTVAALIEEEPIDFVVTSVPRAANPSVIVELVAAGVPVLSETPPAEDLAAMKELFGTVTHRAGRVQVAEQYHLQPHQAARLAVAASGRLGSVTQAQVSVAHGYHGISLLRRFLGTGFELPTIRAHSFASPMIAGPGRGGPPERERVKEFVQTLATLQFDSRLGVFDFVGSQYFGWIRSERVLVRGDRGEIRNNTVSYLQDFRTPVQVELRRIATGRGSDLEGHHLKGYTFGDQWLYENPLVPARLFDDEIAVGTCLMKMKHYVETGEEFYPLTEACHDHYLSILLDQAARTGEPVSAIPQVWCE